MSNRAVRDFPTLNSWGFVLSAALRIASGVAYASSIDNFLKITGDEKVSTLAKAAIAKVILEKERSSKLWFDARSYSNHLDPTKIDGTWYQEFAQLFFEGLTWDEIPNALKNLVVISFNYDRCFEHFMRHATKALYGVDLSEVDKVLQNLNVIHPYGVVGELDWNGCERPALRIEFGGDSSGRLQELSKQIKTFNEDARDAALIQKEVASVRKVVFLGFAFHPQNIELFKVNGVSNEKDVYATTHKISDIGFESVKKDLLKVLGGVNPPNNDPAGLRFFTEPMECAPFLERHRRALTG